MTDIPVGIDLATPTIDARNKAHAMLKIFMRLRVICSLFYGAICLFVEEEPGGAGADGRLCPLVCDARVVAFAQLIQLFDSQVVASHFNSLSP